MTTHIFNSKKCFAYLMTMLENQREKVVESTLFILQKTSCYIEEHYPEFKRLFTICSLSCKKCSVLTNKTSYNLNT